MTRLEKLQLAADKGFTYDSITGNITSPTGFICKKLTKNGYAQLTVRLTTKSSSWEFLKLPKKQRIAI